MAWTDDFTWVEKVTRLGPTALNKVNAAIRELKGLAFDPTDYGCIGDGVTNDTTNLQSAITAVSAVGGKLVSPRGKTYLVSNAMSVTAGCDMDFQGSTIKKAASMTSEALTVSGASVTLRNLVVNGNRSGGASGPGIKTTGSSCLAINVESSHNGTTAGMWINGGSFELRGCKFNDNVQTDGSTGDGIYVATGGVVTMDTSCSASGNGRSGFFLETSAGDNCVVNGSTSLNSLAGAQLRSNRGRIDFLYTEDNYQYGITFDSATTNTQALGWQCGTIVSRNQGKTAFGGNVTANGVQFLGSTRCHIGSIHATGTPGYALAFSGSGIYGCSYNTVGVVHSDTTDATNANPGIVFVAGTGGGQTGSKHNHVGTAYMRGHTVAVNFGETTDGGNDHNSIGLLHAVDCSYGCVWIGNGSYNRVAQVVSRNCYTSDTTFVGLVSFINTTTTTDNVVGSLDHRTVSGTKPKYLVYAAAGTSRNRVETLRSRGDYQTNIASIAGTDNVAGPINGLLDTGVIAETVPRSTVTSNTIGGLTSAQLTLVAINLREGTKITQIAVLPGTTALATGLNQWFALYDKSLNLLGVTTDDTSTAWAANTVKTLTLASPYMTTYEGLYYIGIMVKATTVPTLHAAPITAQVNTISPRIAGTSTSGLTNPASAPNPAAAISAYAAIPYAYVL